MCPAFADDFIHIIIISFLVQMEQSQFFHTGFCGQIEHIRVDRMPPCLKYLIFCGGVFAVMNQKVCLRCELDVIVVFTPSRVHEAQFIIG